MAADLNALFRDVTARYGLPQGYLLRTGQIESSLNPNDVNPQSGAAGLFQFIPSTAQHYGLSNPLDPTASADAAGRLARDNFLALRNGLGRDPSPGELYLAHQQGAGGALKLLSNPTAPAASLVGARAVSLNGGQPDMTAAQFSRLWLDKYAGAPAQGGSIAATAVGQPAAPPPTFSDFLKGAAGPGGMPNPSSIAMQFMASGEAEQKAKRQQAQAVKQAKLAALFAPPAPAGGGLFG